MNESWVAKRFLKPNAFLKSCNLLKTLRLLSYHVFSHRKNIVTVRAYDRHQYLMRFLLYKENIELEKHSNTNKLILKCIIESFKTKSYRFES